MKNISIKYFGFILLISLGMVSCSQETYDNQEIVTEQMLDATFTITELSANNYQITSNSNDYVINNYWDLGNGTGYSSGKNTFKLFLPDAGEYEIKHKVTGAGGIFSTEETTLVTVPTSDPVAGNLIKGGKFNTDDDIAEWSIGGVPGGSGIWTFADNKATLTASGWSGQGIYQAIEVEEGRSYQIDMYISSTSGCTDTWFEVYCGYVDPATISGDYSDGGSLLAINTWAGSGTSAFGQMFTTIATNPEANGLFTATATGTAYLVIRGGGSDMQDGISVTNIELRGVSE
ncbi:hypothetical protein [Saccharicrinis sp. 156]|uniref:hypothetical protein n=1 Tax=Saccharicrinis sp. 156 TaxID=3417574 RepID=UPI003D34B90A